MPLEASPFSPPADEELKPIRIMAPRGKAATTTREEQEEEEDEDEDERSETSSIGACSSADEEEDEEDEEVQSRPNRSPFSLGPDPAEADPSQTQEHPNQSDGSGGHSQKSSLSSLDSLEDSLPCKRGLSNFYSGKSKSFTSLSSAANATVKDIVKPENPLNKRRRLFIARSRLRRASCSSLVSIAESESPFLPPLPPVLSECDDEEDQDEDEEEESVEQADPASPSRSSEPEQQHVVMRRSRTERRRPSLFTVSVTPFEARPDHDPFPTPKSVRSGGSSSSKLALKSPSRSFSLSDLSWHAHLAHPMPDLD